MDREHVMLAGGRSRASSSPPNRLWYKTTGRVISPHPGKKEQTKRTNNNLEIGYFCYSKKTKKRSDRETIDSVNPGKNQIFQTPSYLTYYSDQWYHEAGCTHLATVNSAFHIRVHTKYVEKFRCREGMLGYWITCFTPTANQPPARPLPPAAKGGRTALAWQCSTDKKRPTREAEGPGWGAATPLDTKRAADMLALVHRLLRHQIPSTGCRDKC